MAIPKGEPEILILASDGEAFRLNLFARLSLSLSLSLFLALSSARVER